MLKVKKVQFSFFLRIFHLFKQIILSNPTLETLSLGCWFESLHRVEEIVQLLGEHQPSTIKQLHLASIKNSETPTTTGRDDDTFELSIDDQSMKSSVDIYLPSHAFLPFTALHTLSIDSTYLNNDLLQCFAQQRTPLQR